MSDDNKSPEQEMKKLATDLKVATDEVKKFAETANTEIKNLGSLSKETKESADKALREMNDISTRLSEVEQKMVRRAERDTGTEQKTLGQAVIDDEGMKSILGKHVSRANIGMEIEKKTITSATGTWGSTTSATNSLVVSDRQPVVGLPMRKLTIRDLVSPGSTSSNAIEYAVQVTRTNNAAPVAEGNAKPYSNYAWDLRNFPVRTIAHMIKASKQILDDAPQLQSTIDAEMEYGLRLAEEAQLLTGDGTGVNVLGMIPQATTYSAPFTVTGATDIDTLRLAMLQGVLALYPMTGFVLNPTDWAKIELNKDAQGRYIMGNPAGSIQPGLWGLPVVESISMTAGTFLTGAFKMAAQIFDRENLNILVSTENVDDFEKNMVSIRCEERLAFVVKRPAALIAGSLPQ